MVEHPGSEGRQPRRRRIPLRRKYDGPERRRAHRHRLSGLSLTYKRPLPWRLLNPGPSQPCRVSNITSYGVRFYTFRRLRPHAHIEITFVVPAGVYRLADENNLVAKVIWQKWSEHRQAWRTGAQFIHVAKTTHDDLARMIEDAALHSSDF